MNSIFLSKSFTFELMHSIGKNGIAEYGPDGRKYVSLLSGEWSDTPKFCINCYELVAQINDKPLHLEDRFTSKGAIYDHSSISQAVDISKINRIEVRELIDTESADGITETVRYDSVVLIQRNSGRQIVIAIDNNSIAGDMYYTSSVEHIHRIIEQTNLRLFIE